MVVGHLTQVGAPGDGDGHATQALHQSHGVPGVGHDDVRCPEALDVDLGALAGREHELPRDRPLIVFCHTGRRSLLATQYLRRLGLNQAVNLRGGVGAYALEVDPSMARY